MDKDTLISYQRILSNGGTLERPKLELKREWWSLEENAGQMEFAKDIAALANTPGDVGYIIIGLDANGNFSHSPIPSGKYDDPTKIKGIIDRKVQEPMKIEFIEIEVTDGVLVTLIEIPVSWNRPHCIKDYMTASGNRIQNFIPIRKSTGIYAADKFDLDGMYRERGVNVKHPYRLDVHSKPTTKVIQHIQEARVPVTILNNGLNVNFITEAHLLLNDKRFQCSLMMTGMLNYHLEHSQFVKILSNDMVRVECVFPIDYRRLNNQEVKIEVVDFMGNVVATKMFRTVVE